MTYDYGPLWIDSMQTVINRAHILARCRRCQTAFVGISARPRNATDTVRRKYRRHIQDGTCDDKVNQRKIREQTRMREHSQTPA